MVKTTTAAEEVNTGNALFVDDDIEGAIAHYSAALEIEPQNYEAYVRRSRAHAELEEWEAAIADAESAISVDPSGYMGYLRKGIGCFGTDEFLKARSALKEALTHNPPEKDASLIRRWLNKAEAEVDEAALEAEKKKEQEKEEEMKKKEADEKQRKMKEEEEKKAAAAEEEEKKKKEEAATKPAIDPKKVRYDWFQYGGRVEISVYIRGLQKEAVKVDIGAKNLDVNIALGEGHEFSLDIDLFDEVVPEKSSFNVMSAKVEIVLAKKNALVNWPSLADNGEEKISAPQPQTPEQPKASESAQHPPAHPGTKKNWDKILSSDEYKDDTKPQGDDALNAVFQQIYANGTDEQRRAMIKSFTESGGTVLSTNWDEVGKAPVKGAPPKGQEMHKWSDE